jgi:flagellar assembly protein FliH
MRAAPAKFLFENDFAASDGKPAMALAEHLAKLKEAEAAAFARGFEQGAAEARAEAERRSAAAFERVAAALEGLNKSLAAIEARLETEAVEVAVAVARKLAPELVAREPLAELAALATGCFRNLVKTPHVAVRVSDALHEGAREKLEEIARRCGLDARLVVLAEPDIAPGDCRIEWADGGIDRNASTIAAAIEDAVTRYVNARAGIMSAMPSVQWR